MSKMINIINQQKIFIFFKTNGLNPVFSCKKKSQIFNKCGDRNNQF